MQLFLQIAGGIVGFSIFVAACHEIYFKAVKPMFKTIRTVNKMIDDVETVPELHTKVDALQETLDRLEPMISKAHYELNPNGGRSMKDQLTRVDDTLKNHVLDSTIHNM